MSFVNKSSELELGAWAAAAQGSRRASCLTLCTPLVLSRQSVGLLTEWTDLFFHGGATLDGPQVQIQRRYHAFCPAWRPGHQVTSGLKRKAFQ